MTIDPDSGVIDGTPDNSNVGDSTITVRVEDTHGGDTTTDITVSIINAQPTIGLSSTFSNTILEDDTLEFYITSNDSGQGDTYFDLQNEPDGMILNPSTGEVLWTPVDNQSDSTYTVTFLVEDMNLDVTNQLTENIHVTNRAPVFTPVEDLDWMEDSTLTIDFETDDEQYGFVTYSIPDSMINNYGMFIDADSGIFSWTPNDTLVDTFYVEVTANDHHSGDSTSTEPFTINVINRPPQLTGVSLPFPANNWPENATGTIDINFDDEELGTTHYSITSFPVNNYYGYVWDDTLCTMTWTPDNSHANPINNLNQHQIEFTCIDNQGATASWDTVITVINTPPTNFTIDPDTVPEDSLVYINIDCDDELEDTVAYTITEHPDWEQWQFNTQTGVCSGKPRNRHVGIDSFSVSVNDGNGGSSVAFSFGIVVLNNPPSFLNPPNIITAMENTGIYGTSNLNTDDEFEGGNVEYELLENLGWIQFDSTGQFTGQLTGEPINSHVGYQSPGMHILFNDGNGGSVYIWITVDVGNMQPSITIPDSTTATEDSEYSVDIYSDEEGEGQTHYILNPSPVPPTGMSLDDPILGFITWTPDNTQVGNIYTYYVTVDDGNGSSRTDSMTINLVNNALPDFLTFPDDTTCVTEDQSFSFDVNSDEEGEDLIYSCTEGPEIFFDSLAYPLLQSVTLDSPHVLTIHPDSGWINWKPCNLHAETEYIVTIQMDDGNEGIVESSFDIYTQNTPPTITLIDSIQVTPGDTLTITFLEDSLCALDIDCQDEEFGATYSIDDSIILPDTSIDLDSLTGILTWTPENSHVGYHLFKVNSFDQHDTNGLDSVYFYIDVANMNDPPIARNETVNDTTLEGLSITVWLDTLFTDADSLYEDDLSFIFTEINGDSIETQQPTDTTLVFIPNTNFNGGQTVRIVAYDESSASDTVMYELYFTFVNDPPVAISDVVRDTTDEGQTITLPLDSLFTDADLLYGDDLSFEFIEINGDSIETQQVNDTTLVIIPNTNFNTSQSVKIYATDNSTASDSLIYEIYFTFVNDPPYVAEEDSLPPIVFAESDTDTIYLNEVFSDPDLLYGDTLYYYVDESTYNSLIFDIEVNELSGLTTISTDSTYYNGVFAPVTFYVTDTTARDTAWSSAGITILNQPTAPFVDSLTYAIQFDEDDSLIIYFKDMFRDYDLEYGGDSLTFSIVSYPENLVSYEMLDNTMTSPSDTARMKIKGNTNMNGIDYLITIYVEDSTPDSCSGTFNLTVNAINDAPVITGINIDGNSLVFAYLKDTIDISALLYDVDNGINELGVTFYYSLDSDTAKTILIDSTDVGEDSYSWESNLNEQVVYLHATAKDPDDSVSLIFTADTSIFIDNTSPVSEVDELEEFVINDSFDITFTVFDTFETDTTDGSDDLGEIPFFKSSAPKNSKKTNKSFSNIASLPATNRLAEPGNIGFNGGQDNGDTGSGIRFIRLMQKESNDSEYVPVDSISIYAERTGECDSVFTRNKSKLDTLDGAYSYYLKIEDYSGNLGISDIISTIVDWTIPEIKSFCPLGSQDWSSLNFTSDSICSIKFTYDNDADSFKVDGLTGFDYYQPTSDYDTLNLDSVALTDKAFNDTTEGSRELVLWLKDIAGNEIDSTSDMIIYDKTPPVVQFEDSLYAIWNEGVAVNLQVITFDEPDGVDTTSLLDSYRFEYHIGGALSSNTLVEIDDLEVDTLIINIPGDSINQYSFKYAITIYDNAGNMSRKPEIDTAFYSIEIELEEGTISTDSPDAPEEIKNGFPLMSWNMISFPINLYDKSLESIFVDDLGEYSNGGWKLYRFQDSNNDGENDRFVEFDEATIDSIVPGYAYWLFVSEPGKIIDCGSGITNKIDEDYDIELNRGWNMVGNPFSFPVKLDSIELDIDSVQQVQRYIPEIKNWGDPMDRDEWILLPYRGYAVLYWGSGQVNLSIPPVCVDTTEIYSNVNSGKATPASNIEVNNDEELTVFKKSNPLVPEVANWKVKFSAYADECVDLYNYVGMWDICSDGRDNRDYLEASNFDEYVSLYFSQINWGKYSGQYTTDFRHPNPNGCVWDMEVRTNFQPSDILVRLDESELPEEFTGAIIDMLTLDIFEFDDSDSLLCSQNKATHTSIMKVVIGTPEFVAAKVDNILSTIPLDFGLSQNYPNPFNPSTTICYQIPEYCNVKLEIYNIMGQQVDVLVDGVKAPGYYRTVFEGRSKAGSELASGIYFYRLTTPNFRKVRKMVIVK